MTDAAATPLGSKRDRVLIVLLVLGPLLLAAALRMPLFQDGASYAVEIIATHSAVRHHRFSVLLLQLPAIAGLKFSAAAELAPIDRLQLTLLLFNFSYALVPLVAIAWSWLLARGRSECLMVWPVAVILLLNLVNFSWVSEILIALHLACPLMMASCQSRRRWIDNATVFILTPVIFMLHALVPMLFLGVAAGAMRRASLSRCDRERSLRLAMLFMCAGAARLVYNVWTMTSYEQEMSGPAAIAEYFSFSTENGAFLIVILLMALAMSSHQVRQSRALLPLSLSAAAASCAMTIHNLNLAVITADAARETWLAMSLMIATALLAVLRLGRPSSVEPWARGVLAALWAAALAITSEMMVLAQYPLKSGSTVALGAILLFSMGSDKAEEAANGCSGARHSFIKSSAFIFALILCVKASIWHAAVERLNKWLMTRAEVCSERTEPSLRWVNRVPNTIINNWSLPSLSVVTPRPSKARIILESEDCAVLKRSGAVQIDPWTKLPLISLPFLRVGN